MSTEFDCSYVYYLRKGIYGRVIGKPELFDEESGSENAHLLFDLETQFSRIVSVRAALLYDPAILRHDFLLAGDQLVIHPATIAFSYAIDKQTGKLICYLFLVIRRVSDIKFVDD